ncbi:MAG: hypothetical protein ACLFSB_15945 [Chitinispirillaceae bacterium]
MNIHSLSGVLCFLFLLFLHVDSPASRQDESFDDKILVDSLFGEVRFQYSGTRQWNRLSHENSLHQDGFIKLHEDSHIRLRWPDESYLFAGENTHLLLTTKASQSTQIISRQITVFAGSVFLVIKQKLPSQDATRYHTRVYTPKTSFTFGETSFWVHVDSSSRTISRVLSGSVRLRNITHSNRRIISAGYKVAVPADSQPSPPRALKDAELDSLRGWVPADIVDREISLQIQKARRNHAIISGKLENKITFIPLKDNSGYEGSWQPGHTIASMLAQRIRDGFTDIAVEYVDSLIDDPYSFGDWRKSRYVVDGTIRRFELSQRAEMTASADEYNEFRVADVKVEIRVHDLTRDSTIIDAVASGQVSGPNGAETGWETIGAFSFDSRDSLFVNSILGKAVEQSLEHCAAMIVKEVQK